MRHSTTIQLATAAALALSPAIAAATKLRAGASLPTATPVDASAAQRASATAEEESALIGTPVYAVLGVFVAVALIAVLLGGGGRSPG